MNIKDLIEAVNFQVSVKPQDDFMREVAEGLEKQRLKGWMNAL